MTAAANSAPPGTRQEKLAAALRANLKRRKEQARARKIATENKAAKKNKTAGEQSK